MEHACCLKAGLILQRQRMMEPAQMFMARAGGLRRPKARRRPIRNLQSLRPMMPTMPAAMKVRRIWVVPSKDLVIVRLGLMSNAPENWAALYEWNQKVARAFPDVE